MMGAIMDYRHTLYATALVMTGTIGGALALAIMGKDSAILVAVGGSFVTALIQVLNAKQVDEVKKQVNGRTSELIAKIPDPVPLVTNADGSAPTPFQQGMAVAEFERGRAVTERAGAAQRARCPFPECVQFEGGHSH